MLSNMMAVMTFLWGMARKGWKTIVSMSLTSGGSWLDSPSYFTKSNFLERITGETDSGIVMNGCGFLVHCILDVLQLHVGVADVEVVIRR